jgi:hypothetical protein
MGSSAVQHSGLVCTCIGSCRDQHTPELSYSYCCGRCCPQEQAASLVSALAQYTITLQELENSLLARLANAQVSILHDHACRLVPQFIAAQCTAVWLYGSLLIHMPDEVGTLLLMASLSYSQGKHCGR